jgi:hypothetical protein
VSGSDVISAAYDIGVNGTAAIFIASSGAARGIVEIPFTVPRGCFIDDIWFVHQTQGTGTAIDAVRVSVQTPSSTTVLLNQTLDHTNNIVTVRGPYVIDFTDTQIVANPSVVADFKTYHVGYEWNYDVTLGGTQTAKIFSFILKYHFTSGVEIRERT